MFLEGLLLIIRRYYSVYIAVGLCHAFMLTGCWQDPANIQERQKGKFCVSMCDDTQHFSHSPALHIFITILFYSWSKNLAAYISTLLCFSPKRMSRPRKSLNSKTSSETLLCALSTIFVYSTPYLMFL